MSAHQALPKAPVRTILTAAEAGAWADGFNFLEAAEQTADEIIQAARHRYQAEFARGYEDGRGEGAAEATLLVVETAAKIDTYLAHTAAALADLAFGIIRQALAPFDRKDLVVMAAMTALADFRREKFLKVTVHPSAVEPVRDELQALVAARGLGLTLTVEADPGMPADACTVASESSVVDARLEGQLEALRRSLDSRASISP